MAKFLFVIPPFLGHINPTLSIGSSLLKKGHEVGWTGVIPLDKKYIPKGGSYFYPEKELESHKEEIGRIIELQGKGTDFKGLEILKLALEDTYIPFAKIMMPGINSVIDNFKPDVIINDCITFAGGLAAHLRKIPYATTTTSPPDVMGNPEAAPKVAEWAAKLISDLQHSVGIYEKGEFINSNKLNMILTSKEFAGLGNYPDHMKFIGPVYHRPEEASFDWKQLSEISTPKIYVTLGTVLTEVRKEFFSRMIEAFENKPFTFILSADPGLFETWPKNFIVQSHLPQLELLKQVDLVICHGGFNTISETLMNGLPMIVIPLAYDQFHNASLIERSGTGIRIRYKRMRPNQLEDSLKELLNNSSYKKAAEIIRQSFIRAGGNNKAVELLEAML